jgi:import inner membrane translocase subunit TIM21
VFYYIWTDIVSPNSKTANFNRAVTRVRASPECIDLLGPSIKATGESMWSSYARARQVGPTPMTEVSEDKRTGIRTIRMRFKVIGKKAEGWVTLHMEQKSEDFDFHFVLLALDVPGHNRVYIEGGTSAAAQKGKLGNIFGVNFR